VWWHAVYGTSDHIGELLGKIEGPHHSDVALEEGIRAELAQEECES